MKKPKHTYKDNTFCALFSDKENLIELYNALSGSNYDMDTPVEIVTLDDAFFGDRENDLSFIIDHKWIILTEQQSTLCPNIPLRMLVYIAREYEKMMQSLGEDYEFEKTPTGQSFDEYILELGENQQVLVNSRYMIAATIRDNSIVAHFNNQPLHTAPLTINMVYNAMAR